METKLIIRRLVSLDATQAAHCHDAGRTRQVVLLSLRENGRILCEGEIMHRLAADQVFLDDSFQH